MNTIRTIAIRITRLVPARKSVRLLLAGVIATASLVGGFALVGGSAQAATTLSGCFKWSNGAAYANQPVNLMQWNGAKWVGIRGGKTNSAGCGTFYNTPGGGYLTMSATRVINDGYYITTYNGWSPNYADPGNFHGGLRTGVVYPTAQVRTNSSIAAEAWGY